MDVIQRAVADSNVRLLVFVGFFSATTPPKRDAVRRRSDRGELRQATAGLGHQVSARAYRTIERSGAPRAGSRGDAEPPGPG